MPKFPVLKPQEVERLLNNKGFYVVRQKGSHKQFRNQEGKGTTVPFHQGEDISPVLLKKIIRDIESTLEEFLGI